jgi:hypothetical protein
MCRDIFFASFQILWTKSADLKFDPLRLLHRRGFPYVAGASCDLLATTSIPTTVHFRQGMYQAKHVAVSMLIVMGVIVTLEFMMRSQAPF